MVGRVSGKYATAHESEWAVLYSVAHSVVCWLGGLHELVEGTVGRSVVHHSMLARVQWGAKQTVVGTIPPHGFL